MNVNDILKNKTLTLKEFQKEYMDKKNALADVYNESGAFLFTFSSSGVDLPFTGWNLIIKNISSDVYYSLEGDPRTMYRIVCEVPDYNKVYSNKNYGSSFTLDFIYNDIFGLQELYDRNSKHIEKVIFNGPATILFWGDGTKTVVKNNSPQESDPEKGILYAIVKKLVSNKKLYNEYLRLIDKEVYNETR